MAFPIEVIPDDARLFRRIPKAQYDTQTGKASSAAFNHERMSVNWEKYSTAAESADDNSAAVTALVSGLCKGFGQTIEHTPIEPGEPFGPNQAHAEVCGIKKKVVCRQLRDLAEIVWLRT